MRNDFRPGLTARSLLAPSAGVHQARRDASAPCEDAAAPTRTRPGVGVVLRTLALTGAGLLVACGGDKPADGTTTPPDGPEGEAKQETRTDAQASGGDVADQGRKVPRNKRAHAPAEGQPAVPLDAPKTVVFVVMDTVRADHTSLCGYERPTTPTLKALVDKGAVYTCHGKTPGSWTHPAHASMFTGVPVVEHGAIWVEDSEVELNPVTKVRPLAKDYLTLAEQFRGAGYATAAVSANIILNEPSGLLQGFDQKIIGKRAQQLRGDKMVKALETALRTAGDEKDLFLFVNLYDAHDPYPEVPAGLGWVEPQPVTHLEPNVTDRATPYARFLKGEMPEAEKGPFLQMVTDGYDHGVFQADATLGKLLKRLAKRGRDKDLRLLVTSDHGEFLGEHGLLRHGGYLHEPVAGVPVVYLELRDGDVVVGRGQGLGGVEPAELHKAKKKKGKRKKGGEGAADAAGAATSGVGAGDALGVTAAEGAALKELPPRRLPEPMNTMDAYSLLLAGRLPVDATLVQAVSEKNESHLLTGEVSAAMWTSVTDKRKCVGGEHVQFDLKADPGEEAAEPVAVPLKDMTVLCAELETLLEREAPDDGEEMTEALRAVGYVE